MASAEPRERPGWLIGAERGAATGVLAVALGPAPFYALYLWRNWGLVPPDLWRVLIAQALTYAVAAGALWGMFVGVVLVPRRQRLKTHVHALLRAHAGAFAGAVGCIPAGVIAAIHFGQMSTPYFGGTEILAGTAGAILVAGVRFARAQHGMGVLAAMGQTILPLPFILLLLLPLSLLPGGTLALELDALRSLSDSMGLGTLGAVVGAVLGGVAGCWMGLVSALPPLPERLLNA